MISVKPAFPRSVLCALAALLLFSCGAYDVATDDAEAHLLLATDDFYIMGAGGLSVSVTGVLANDTHLSGRPLSAEMVSGPASAASMKLNPDGSFAYVPNADFRAEDRFTYRAHTGAGESEIANVTITLGKPAAQRTIAGGGVFFWGAAKCTFGFAAQEQAGPVKGQLEVQDSDSGLKIEGIVDWIHLPDPARGSFSGTCSVNGAPGFSFFVKVRDTGQKGDDDQFALWVLGSANEPLYKSRGTLSRGNIVIRGK